MHAQSAVGYLHSTAFEWAGRHEFGMNRCVVERWIVYEPARVVAVNDAGVQVRRVATAGDENDVLSAALVHDVIGAGHAADAGALADGVRPRGLGRLRDGGVGVGVDEQRCGVVVDVVLQQRREAARAHEAQPARRTCGGGGQPDVARDGAHLGLQQGPEGEQRAAQCGGVHVRQEVRLVLGRVGRAQQPRAVEPREVARGEARAAVARARAQARRERAELHQRVARHVRVRCQPARQPVQQHRLEHRRPVLAHEVPVLQRVLEREVRRRRARGTVLPLHTGPVVRRPAAQEYRPHVVPSLAQQEPRHGRIHTPRQRKVDRPLPPRRGHRAYGACD